AAGPPLAPRTVTRVIEHFLPPGYRQAFHGADERMWWANAPPRSVPGKPNSEVDWLFTVARPGVLQFAVCLGRLIDDDPRISVGGFQLEAWIVRMTERLLKEADALGLGGAAVVDVDCMGFENVDLLAGRLPSIRVRRGTINLSGPVIMPGDTPVG